MKRKRKQKISKEARDLPLQVCSFSYVVKAMEREEEDVGILPEHVLGAIAVVDIKVQDQDPAQPKLISRMGRRHSHIVEQTKAHGV